MSELYIGLISGTSIDAIDAVLVDFSSSPFQLIATHSHPYPTQLREALHEICQPGDNEINRLGQLDRQVGIFFANACEQLLSKARTSPELIVAIGSHGQTIRHHPGFPYPFTLQIGDPNTIAELTGITTIADFRRRDMVRGGQGAPLTPAFHNFAFRSNSINRVIVNIGGIANLTFLPLDCSIPIIGFDSGPGNTLLDNWAKVHLKSNYDSNGTWAKRGQVNTDLLNRLLKDTYFQLPFPKSTGREYFNLAWLESHLLDSHLSPEDIQSTLTELTSQTIMDTINNYFNMDHCEILLCGGGVHNLELVSRLHSKKGQHRILSTGDVGVDPDWVEAIGFAWLGRQTLRGLPGNLPAVTGASQETILGGIFPRFL